MQARQFTLHIQGVNVGRRTCLRSLLGKVVAPILRSVVLSEKLISCYQVITAEPGLAIVNGWPYTMLT